MKKGGEITSKIDTVLHINDGLNLFQDKERDDKVYRFSPASHQGNIEKGRERERGREK